MFKHRFEQGFDNNPEVEIPILSAPNGFDICNNSPDTPLVVTRAELLTMITDYLTGYGYTAPAAADGQWDLTHVNITNWLKGKDIYCDVLDEEYTVSSSSDITVIENTNTDVINSGGTQMFGQPAKDANCNGKADTGSELASDFEITLAPNTAININLCVACFEPIV